MMNNYYPNYAGGNFFDWRNSPENVLKRNNSSKVKKTYIIVGLALCLLYAALFMSQLVLMIVAMAVDKNVMSTWWFNLFMVDVPIYGIGLWVFMFFMSKLESKKPQKKNFKLYEMIPAMLIIAFFMMSGSIVGNTIHTTIQSIFGVEIDDALTAATESMSLPVQILFLVIIAPIGEELIFRKLILDRTAQYGEGAAIMFSAIAFSLFHANVPQFIYAFTAGLLLGYVYVRTGSYIKCVFLHGATNAIFGIIYPYFAQKLYTEGISPTEEMISSIVVGVTLLCIVAGLVFFIIYLAKKKVYLEKSVYPLEKSAFFAALVNPPFIVYVAILLFSALSMYIPSVIG